jgi:methylmalonyl-CoA mutase C-terminal domain/subunit
MPTPSGSRCCPVRTVIDLLASHDAEEVLVFGGGIIPDGDIPQLKALGVAEIFTPGAPLPAISRWLEDALDRRESASTA